MTKAVFLDRDGVINRKAPEGDYITRWEEFHLLPGVVEGIAEFNRAGLRVIVITNQRCVAKGLMTTAELEAMHERMRTMLAGQGAKIEAIYYCPHEMEPVCRCRKPAAGMFFDAAHDFAIELEKSWMIGDSNIDIEAGKNAGCKTVLLSDGIQTRSHLELATRPDIVAGSFGDAVRHIAEYERAIAGTYRSLSEASR